MVVVFFSLLGKPYHQNLHLNFNTTSNIEWHFIELNEKVLYNPYKCSYNPRKKTIENHLKTNDTHFDLYYWKYDLYSWKYYNYIAPGDSNADVARTPMGDLTLVYYFENLVKCYKNCEKSSYTDRLLTGRPKSFHKTHTTEIGLLDFHKMTVPVMKMNFESRNLNLIYKTLICSKVKCWNHSNIIDSDLQKFILTE